MHIKAISMQRSPRARLAVLPSVLLLFGTLQCIGAGDSEKPILMPVPQSLVATGEEFRLGDDFAIAIQGAPHERLYRAASRVLRRIAGRTGLFIAQEDLLPGKTIQEAAMIIEVTRPGEVTYGEDESYTLTVKSSGIHLSSPTDIGAMRGLETVIQLIASDGDGYFIQGVQIVDKPRFGWRGLMIDASRHFMPMEVIRRNLDGMAAVKLNVFHWHLSDDQGFRVESKTYPRLHEVGSDGLYYTQQQIREIISYAGDRGIRVVPEFDVPGHATSWLLAYPELASGSVPSTIERKWGIFYPVMNPAKEATYSLLDGLFGEMAQLFPDQFFHIGGDEIEHQEHVAKDWNDNPEIKALKNQKGIKDNQELQAYFNERVLTILTKHKKTMMGWDEILHDRMPKEIVIQSWRGRESMEIAARKGYRSVLSNGYYIDLIQPTEFHYLNDPLPADTPLSPEEQKSILGGEATMWSEFVSPETIDSRIWPRQIAIAERLWSPQNVTDVDDMFRRMDVVSLQLEEHGLTHEKNYSMLLRRLIRDRNILPLKTFVDVVEPVEGYNRGRLRPHTSFSPLTRVVDAARPDGREGREFRRSVDRYVANPAENGKEADGIRKSLETWRDNHEALAPIIAASPSLKEIEPLSEILAKIAILGLDALDVLSDRKKVENLQGDAEAVLKDAKESHGQVELMVVSAIEKLTAAALHKNGSSR